MKRNKIKDLLRWKENKSRKPLILLGARQVGKTYLLKEFGKAHYEQIAYINFENPLAPRGLFESDFDHKRIITILNAYCNLKIEAENTLIVFDEIQAAEKGLTVLKYFYENAPEYHVIAAGSLLGVNIHPGESFPVGKVDFIHLYPMSFLEFLWALEENDLADMLNKKDFKSLHFFHEKLKTYLRYYLFVGGMPEAVKQFVENRDWNEVRSIQNQILQSYRNDFSKHAPKEILPRINMVWDSLPAQLAKENKKFIYGVIKKGARAKDFELALQWLTDAGLLHKVYHSSKPALPLKAYQNLSWFKLFHNDVGLLGALSELSAQTIALGDTLFEEFKGALAEQFVFQQMRQKENLHIYYHSFDGTKYEIDFLVQNEEGQIIPIEVKSGNRTKATSFKQYCYRHHPQKAIRFSLQAFQEEEWMSNYPLYAAGEV